MDRPAETSSSLPGSSSLGGRRLPPDSRGRPTATGTARHLRARDHHFWSWSAEHYHLLRKARTASRKVNQIKISSSITRIRNIHWTSHGMQGSQQSSSSSGGPLIGTHTESPPMITAAESPSESTTVADLTKTSREANSPSKWLCQGPRLNSGFVKVARKFVPAGAQR